MSIEFKFQPFLTIYRKDYVHDSQKRLPPVLLQSEFADPIAQSFKKYLTLKVDNVQLPEEDVEIYLNKFKENNGKLAKMYFSKPLKVDVLLRAQAMDKRSTYQADICDLDADLKYVAEKEARKVRLPDDTVIDLTTQRRSYKDPRKIYSRAGKREPVKVASNNIGKNEKIEKILNITTGESEYMAEIGTLGEFIKQTQMHGKLHHPPCQCTIK